MQKIEQFWESCKTDIQPLPVDLYEGMYEEPEEEEEVEEKPSVDEELTAEKIQILKKISARRLPKVSAEEAEFLAKMDRKK